MLDPPSRNSRLTHTMCRIWLLTTMLAGWTAAASPAAKAVHPLSYTDAWVKVGDTIDVRLNLFLDDVLRYDGCLPDDPEATVDTELIRRAIKRQTDRLKVQLRLFDSSGILLPTKVISQPEFKPGKSAVRLDSYANTRLSWKLNHAGKVQTALSLLHEFSDAALTTPGELRLRMQTAKRKRIDSVIAPGILFTADLTATGHDTDAVLLTSTIVVSPASVLVEMTGEPPVFQQLISTEEGFQRYSESEVEPWLASISDWAQQNILLSAGGQNLTPVNAMCEFLNEEQGNATRLPKDSQARKIAKVGVRLRYARPPSMRQLSVLCQGLPDNQTSVLSQLKTPFEHQCRVTTVSENQVSSAFQLTDSWSEPTVSFPELLVVNDSEFRQGVTVRIGCALLFGIGVGWLRRKRRPILTGAISSVIVGSAWLALFSAPVDCDVPAIQRHVLATINQCYQATLQIDETATFQRLNEVMTDDCVEDVYPQLIKGLLTNEGVVTGLQQLQASVDKVTKFDSDTIVVDAQWNLSATLNHWQHSHSRQFAFAGQITFERPDSRWKIAKVALKRGDVTTRPAGFAE